MNELTTATEPADSMDVYGLDALKVMADSLRMQIVDILRQDGATVKEIAANLGVSPKSLYYHVNLLEKHGLIRVVDSRLVSGIVEKRYRATAYLFNFQYLNASSPATAPEQIALESVASLFAITQDEIRVSIESGLIETGECVDPAHRLNTGWQLLQLSPAGLEELGARFEALIEEYEGRNDTSPEARPYRLLATLFPTYRRGERPHRRVHVDPQEG